MEAFLEKIAGSVTKENLPYLYNSCYIFPTKRASLYFIRFLQKKFAEENFILPETITIQDFITQHSSYVIRDDWDLLLDIYRIQNELTKTEQPLEKFMPWGKMILKDFDECDKYLVDARQLFSLLKAQKEIDETFSISEETRKYIEQFILTATAMESSKEHLYKNEFIKTWNLLGDLYAALQRNLRERNFAYEGMAYREVYDRLRSKNMQLPYDKIIFCGFNALSVCEEKIFEIVEKNYHTEFWWDADDHFMSNDLHEAGNFLRKYAGKFNGSNSHWVFDSTLQEEKKIEIIGVPSNVGQAEYVSQNLARKENETSAIVLCDEHLLQPLLYAVDTAHSNITMGYSVSQSELYLLVNSLICFYANAHIGTSGTDYYHKDIENLSRHSFLKAFIQNRKELENKLPFFVPYMPAKVLARFFPPGLLKPVTASQEALHAVRDLLFTLTPNDHYFYPVREAIAGQIQALLQSFEDGSITLDRKALPFIVKQFLSALKIPFETNTSSNVQIMGFLETRILDFDHLYILSLNDENLPGTNKTNSFIPYNLRKGFGLPTFEQFDGINAYHFYRLLKRAKTIHLLYNNQVGDNASEKSRFIRQLQHDLSQKNAVAECIAALENKGTLSVNAAPLKIRKTPEIVAALRKRLFSSSALKIYIQCPLQFYLRYIAGIDEPEELTEEIDAAVFGQILHKTLELTYRPHLGKLLQTDAIKKLYEETALREKLKEACDALDLPKEITHGSNKLQLKIIERIAQKIMQNDAAVSPLTVLKTEEKFTWDKLRLEDGSFAALQGTFDRIDKMGNGVRIIDYKTGQIELPKFPDSSDESIAIFLDSLFLYTNKDYSAAFQGLLYALMYYKLYHCTEIYVGYHHAKKMKEGISYLNDERPIPVDLLLHFEKRLSALVTDIIYKDEYFTQTENENAYKFSAYAGLLGIDAA
jgi:hypothetical protein